MNQKAKTITLFSLAASLLGGALMVHHSPEASAEITPPKVIPEPPAPPAEPQNEGRVQIALLLDTSGSMSGLIEQAKSQLWKVVNEMSSARRNGKAPWIELALFEYGKGDASATEGYVRMIAPMTDDLDRISEALFALKTNGGEEYAGRAIDTAVKRLKWSDAAGDLRFIFIAGNESFRQGDLMPEKAIANATEKGIVVNTIYCGSHDDRIASGWRSGAALADGRFISIDHNMKIVQIDAPQDAQIAKLGVALNKTYIPYGRLGAMNWQRQHTQDSNALSMNMASNVSRMVAKSSANYYNPHWDLVDYVQREKGELAKIDVKALPQNMRGMNEAERAAYVDAQAKKRQALKLKISELNAARTKFVAEARKNAASKGDKSLDTAMIEAVHQLAAVKGFTF